MWSDEGELRMSLRDAREEVRLAGREEHDRQVRHLGRRPEPVRGAVGEPRGLFDGDVDANPEHTGIRRR
jgi:hypothetical protein